MEEPLFIKCELVTESSPNLNTEELHPVSLENIKVEADLANTDQFAEVHSLGIVKEELDIQDTKEEFIPELDDTDGPSSKQSKPEVSHTDPLLSPAPGSFKCDLCGKVLTSRAGILQHLMAHTGLKPHECSVCNKAFARSGNCARHVRTHTGVKLYNICNKEYRDSSSLSLHLRTHTGDRPFSCPVCSKAFYKRGTLQEHMRLHTGERPYKCEVCGKTYSNSSALSFHSRARTHTHTHTHTYTPENDPTNAMNVVSRSLNQTTSPTTKGYTLASVFTSAPFAVRCSQRKVICYDTCDFTLVSESTAAQSVAGRLQQECKFRAPQDSYFPELVKCSVSQYGVRVSGRRSLRLVFERAQPVQNRFINRTTFPARKYLQNPIQEW